MQPRKLVATALLGSAIVCSSAATATVSNPQFNIVPVDAAWRAGLPRDAAAATQAYLDRLPPQVVARANAYFEGGSWLQLWNLLIALAVTALIAGLGVGLLYAAIRRAGERWWLWGTGVAVALLTVVFLIAPVWIDPLFNTYKPVENAEVRAAVIAMARAEGVPADNVYEFDASRQTTRVSANVSGIFGTAAVRLNDNLLRRCSLPEIRADGAKPWALLDACGGRFLSL